MHAHGRFEQEAWTYDEETLDALPRATSLLHERLVPYVRAAAATAARCGLPIIRPLALTDPATPRLGDRRRLRLRAVAVGRAGAGGRRARGRGRPARRATGSTPGTGAEIAGGGDGRRAPRRSTASRCGSAAARSSSPTRPTHVARGLGRHAGAERPLEATLWGEPPCGRARRPAGRRHGRPLHARRVVGQRRPRRGVQNCPEMIRLAETSPSPKNPLRAAVPSHVCVVGVVRFE